MLVGVSASTTGASGVNVHIPLNLTVVPINVAIQPENFQVPLLPSFSAVEVDELVYLPSIAALASSSLLYVLLSTGNISPVGKSVPQSYVTV